MRYAILLGALWAFVVPAWAAGEQPVSRREGFLLLWQSIRRPAEESRERPFDDVAEGDEGFLEITYAKERGILDSSASPESDEQRFHPDDPLTLDDALLWLLRTRNVAELDAMTSEHLPALLERYQIADPAQLSASLMRDQLFALIQRLDADLAAEVHEVSFYAEDFHGDGTAFGETFDMHALTAAHRTFPYNTLVRVTNVENGRSVVVRINDRGPYVEGRDMDLSLAAFLKLAERSRGKINARFERLGDASLVDACAPAGPRLQQRITRDVRFRRGIPQTFSLGGELVLQANRPFVLRGISYPDGHAVRMQDFVFPEERFSFTPSVAGPYRFRIQTAQGRGREMRMNVVECSGEAM